LMHLLSNWVGKGLMKRRKASPLMLLAWDWFVGAVFLCDAVYMCVSLDAELDCNEI